MLPTFCGSQRFVFCVFQEIVGSLVTPIGSGFSGEVDSSLSILADLVENHTKAMAPFDVFIKVRALLFGVNS